MAKRKYEVEVISRVREVYHVVGDENLDEFEAMKLWREGKLVDSDQLDAQATYSERVFKQQTKE